YISAATGNAVTSMPFPTTAGQSITGTAYLGNIIAANRGNGVNLENSASQNLIVANTIGATSSTPNGKPNLLVGNSGDGILITKSSGNTIGDASLVPTPSTTSPAGLGGAANVVSGNAGDGISVSLSGATSVAGNLVSFNTQNGIHFVGDLSA